MSHELKGNDGLINIRIVVID